MPTRVSELLLPLAAIDKLGARSISVSEVREVPWNGPVMIRNPAAHTTDWGHHRLIPGDLRWGGARWRRGIMRGGWRRWVGSSGFRWCAAKDRCSSRHGRASGCSRCMPGGVGRGSRTDAGARSRPRLACHDRAQLWRGRAMLRPGHGRGGLGKGRAGRNRMLRSSLPTLDPHGAFGEVLDRATADVRARPPVVHIEGSPRTSVR
jgi:hypothetical protein